jgi:hypothetical protein
MARAPRREKMRGDFMAFLGISRKSLRPQGGKQEVATVSTGGLHAGA